MRDLNNGLDEKEQEEFKKNRDMFEKILMEGMNGIDLNALAAEGDDEDEDFLHPPPGKAGKAKESGGPSGQSTSSSQRAIAKDIPSKQAGSTTQGGDSFQKNIRQTMDKLRESESTVNVILLSIIILKLSSYILNIQCRLILLPTHWISSGEISRVN